jgi:hypothetical protein
MPLASAKAASAETFKSFSVSSSADQVEKFPPSKPSAKRLSPDGTAGVGDWVGVVVGVGEDDGGEVGVGEGDGVDDGLAVGPRVGVGDDVGVGEALGSDDGLGVGVGEEVGDDIGEVAVGVAVGSPLSSML